MAGYFTYQWLFPGDERRIRTALDGLAATAREPSGEGLAPAARAARLGDFFTRDAVIDAGPGLPSLSGRDAIVGLAATARPGDGFVLRFVDIDVTVGPAGDTALVRLTATMKSRGLGDRETVDAREFLLEWRKVEGRWLIGRVTGQAAIERPAGPG